MTAVGLFARFCLGQDPAKVLAMHKAADLLLQQPPVWDEAGGRVAHYAWHDASYALLQTGGKRWKAWQQPQPTLLAMQHRDGQPLRLRGPRVRLGRRRRRRVQHGHPGALPAGQLPLLAAAARTRRSAAGPTVVNRDSVPDRARRPSPRRQPWLGVRPDAPMAPELVRRRVHSREILK
jgi:hypothetical protein